MYHLHTGERIDVVYRIGGNYLPDAVGKLNRFLRDHRTGDEKDYDVKEFDLLRLTKGSGLAAATGVAWPGVGCANAATLAAKKSPAASDVL
jgi:uncharacterized protein YcbK (DUF882 family)